MIDSTQDIIYQNTTKYNIIRNYAILIGDNKIMFLRLV